MNKPFKIAAVIVTYNRLDKLKLTLAAYLDAGVDQLIIVNNASTDNTTDFLQRFHLENHDVTVLNLPENTGGAGGFYAGLKYAREQQGIDWVITSDDDSYPAKNAITLFKSHYAKATPPSLFASAVYYLDGKICPMNQPMLLQGFMATFLNIFTREKLTGMPHDNYQSSAPTAITASSFVGLFIPHQTLISSQVLPDPRFFLYWDDIAFCLDMKKKHVPLSFLPDIHFIHDCPRKTQQLQGQRFYYMVRNGIRVINRLPTGIKYLSLLIKLPLWGACAAKNKSIREFIQAVRDV